MEKHSFICFSFEVILEEFFHWCSAERPEALLVTTFGVSLSIFLSILK